MRREIDKVVIQEPPIQELSKKKSCLKRSCLTGGGCIAIFLIASLLILKWTTEPRIKELKNLPANFPSGIPVYDQDNILKITFISGKEKGRGLEIIAFVPKLVLSPLLLALDKNLKNNESGPSNNDQNINNKTGWEYFIQLIKKPVADHRDTLQIEWGELPAEPKFIQEYYQSELQKNNFQTNLPSLTDNVRQFTFQQNEITGAFYIEDEAKKSGTDYFSLTVKWPRED